MRLTFLSLCLAALLAACGNSNRVQVTPGDLPELSAKTLAAENFFRAIVGEYDIFEAGPVGGPFKKFDGYVGTVEIYDGEVGLTFPYCPPGQGCLPGYAYFPLKSVVATGADRVVIFTARLDDGTAGRFHWSEDKGTITFVNEQLEHSDGKKKAIEYHLKRR